MSLANVTPTQALSRLLAAAKQINADECKDEYVFHALQGEIGVAEGVLRDYAEPEPVAYLRFRAAQSWSGSGNHDIEHNEWLETCHAHEIGDDKLPAFPVYAAPVASQPVGAAPAQEPVAYRTTFNDFRHFSGATASGRDYVQFQKPEHDSRFFEGCDSLVITPLYAEPVAAQSAVAAASVPEGWKLVPVAPTPKMVDATWHTDFSGVSENKRNKFIYAAMLAAAPLHEAGNAAAVQEPLNADQIEELMPDNEGDNGAYPCDKCGWIQVSAQWLHDFARNVHQASQNQEAAPSIAAPTEVERVKALQVARAALKTADYAIKGREHTGFINNAIAVIDAAIATGEKHE